MDTLGPRMPPHPPPMDCSNPTTTRPTPSLSQALINIARAAATRAKDGQRVYGPIASLWDEYLQSDAVHQLPPWLCKPLTALCTEINLVANRHFDAYIKGSPPAQAVAHSLNIENTEPEPVDQVMGHTTPPPTTIQKPASYA